MEIAHGNFSSLESRLSSFSEWKCQNIISKDNLARNGFFKYYDNVMCGIYITIISRLDLPNRTFLGESKLFYRL
jgi:hypothetical protein